MREAPSATRAVVTRGLREVVSIETPELVRFEYTLAGVGSRAAAALIDHAILLAVTVALGVLLVLLLRCSAGFGAAVTDLAQRAGGWFLALLLLAQFVLQWGYYVLFEALWDGQTPGKRWLGLRVVQDGGYSVSFGASAARNIARILDMQPLSTYGVALLAVGVSKTGKRLGDHLAGTIVVRERLVSGPARRGAFARGDVAPSTLAADPAGPGAGPRAGDEPLPVVASLTEDELELLGRFLERAVTMDPERRAALAGKLAERLAPALRDRPPSPDLESALRALYESERALRARGVAGRGETGVARERYALILEGEERWNRFAAMLADAQRRGLARMSADEVAAFVAEYRVIATDLARLSTAAAGRDLDAVFRLSRLVAGGHNLLYRQDRLRGRDVARFLFRTVPAELRRSAAPILAAAALLFGSGAAAFLGVLRDPLLAQEIVPPALLDRAELAVERAKAGDTRYIDVQDYTRPILASAVIRNNVQVSFLAFASGLSAGILTAVLLLFNGISIGAAIGVFAARGVGMNILDFVIAHGVFELSAIAIAAGGGFVIARALVLPGPRTRREALVLQGRRALRLLAAATLLLLAAGAIEGLISPRADLGFAAKAAVAALSALLLAGYVALGRGGGEDDVAFRERMAYGENAPAGR